MCNERSVEYSPMPSRSARTTLRYRHVVWMLVIAWFAASAVFIFGAVLWRTTRPNTDVVARESTPLRLVYDDQVVPDLEPILSSENGLLIPVDFLFDYLESPVYIEEEDDATYLVWSTPAFFLEIQVGEPQSWINEDPAELFAPTVVLEGAVYVAADFVTRLTATKFEHHSETGRVMVDPPGQPHIEAELRAPVAPHGTVAHVVGELWDWLRSASEDENETVALRLHPTLQSPVVMTLPVGERVRIVGGEDGWTRVNSRGLDGYVHSASIGEQHVVVSSTQPWSEEGLPEMSQWSQRQPGMPLSGERINLVWEQVGHMSPDPQSIGALPGVNVVSPTWFHLADEEGRLRNTADYRYVKWAHEQNIRVWGLVSNSFDPDLTSKVLNSREARRAMIRNILTYAEIYDLDGINIDFENVFYEDRDIFTQFVRELVPLAHRQGLTMSIDITMISSSPTWSMFYDRRALAEVVDYVMLMAYDEHWAASPVAGSVASLPWVESGLRRILEEVPADKLVLGIPFYMRIWEETTDSDGQTKVSSRAVGIRWFQEHYADKADSIEWDAEAGQHYLEYEEGDAKYRIWIEDGESLQARLAVVHKYGLAGVAAWRRGLEVPETWEIIKDAMRWWP